MKKIIALLMIAASSLVFAAKEPVGVIYDWKILRVVDGDTVEVATPWVPAPIKQKMSIRIYGVDTPEKGWRGQCDKEKAMGEAASKFTKKVITESKVAQVWIIGWDKYGGRILGDIILDGKSLRKMLIEKGFAREYYGDAKKSWCN